MRRNRLHYGRLGRLGSGRLRQVQAQGWPAGAMQAVDGVVKVEDGQIGCPALQSKGCCMQPKYAMNSRDRS